MAEPKLTEDARTFIVQALACYDTPSVVVEAVRQEYGLRVTRQTVEGYDPTKRAGRTLSAKWSAVFHETRKTFLEDTSAIAVSHRAVRLRAIQRMAAKAEEMGNLPLAAQLLEQAAKETGGSFTNKRELSGPNGRPFVEPVLNVTISPRPEPAPEAG